MLRMRRELIGLLALLIPNIISSVWERRRLKIVWGSVIPSYTLLSRLLATVRRALSKISQVKFMHFPLQDISLAHLHLWLRNLLLFSVKVFHRVKLKLSSIADLILPLILTSFVGAWLCNHLNFKLGGWIFSSCLLCDVARGWKRRSAENCLVL